MSSSTFGRLFRITTWGESHGPGIGVVVDGVPAGLELDREDIQLFLDRRKPGQSKYTTRRSEEDQVEILSGIFEGKTTGTPISLLIRNKDQRSRDYGNIASVFRPGHADYPYTVKYGFRDYRGGGRSSGRETIGRVAAGAIASKLLSSIGVNICAYTRSVGPHKVEENELDLSQISKNVLYMPSNSVAEEAGKYLEQLMSQMDSSGGVIECIATGLPVGLGEPVFDKLDALLAQAVMSIGAVKAVEIGDGTEVAKSTGSKNNDPFYMEDGHVKKRSNHAGGTLGGLSDGSPLLVRASVKPTSSIAQKQNTVTASGEDTEISIFGRHDPIIVPRAVVVVESMVSIVLCDLLLQNMTKRLDFVQKIYGRE